MKLGALHHVPAAARQALQWRLLLLWLLALLLPLVLAMAPLWLSLGAVLDRAPLAQRLLDSLDLAVLADTLAALSSRGYSPAAALLPLAVLTALLLPWIAGCLVAAARALHRGEPPLRLGPLLRGGLAEYGLMFRVQLLALVLLGVAGAAGGAALDAAGEQARKLLLESDADLLQRAVLFGAVMLFLLVHATVDAARAQLVLEPRRRSVLKAWWRGLRGLRHQPSRLLLFLLFAVAGLLLAAPLAWARTQLAPVGVLSFIGALLLGQLLVMVLGWMRSARLFGLVLAGRG